MKWKNYYFIIIYSILLTLANWGLNFIETFFLVPIFFYLFYEKTYYLKKILILAIILIISSLINFYYLLNYGFTFMIILGIANFIFYFLFFYFSKILLKKKFNIVTIPSLFLCLYYILGFSILNNFWINYLFFLKYLPISIKIIGSLGNLFLLVSINVLIFNFIKNRKKINKIPIYYFIIFTIIFFNFFIFNNFYFTKNYENNNSIKIAGIQGNIKENWEERFNNTDKNMKIYLNLSKIAMKQKPNIIIWPEYVFTEALQYDFKNLNKLKYFSNKNNITLIVGSFTFENFSNSNSKRYNTLYIFKNNSINYYNAYKAVTLGDNQIMLAQKNKPFKYENNSIGLFLCYEEYFQYLFSNSINRKHAKFFLVSGNLYQVNNKIGKKITALISKIRAIENNRYLFRLETSGQSQVVDNNGLIVKKIPSNQKGILTYNIPLISDKTFYSIYQKEIDFIIFLISLFILIYFNKDDLKKYFKL